MPSVLSTPSASTLSSSQDTATSEESLATTLSFVSDVVEREPKRVKLATTTPTLGTGETLMFHKGKKDAPRSKQVRICVVTGPDGTVAIVITNTVELCQFLKAKNKTSHNGSPKTFFDRAQFAGNMPPEPLAAEDWAAVTDRFPFLAPHAWVHSVYKVTSDGTIGRVNLKEKLNTVLTNADVPAVSSRFGFFGVKKTITQQVSDDYLECFERGGLTEDAPLVFQTSQE
mmetsp:Transcript_10376/g.31308  ORF Transcript_10376/g.31308 Transcript_10376/m.31308 type:complete len:228 (+) Transcript_10376:79-762(+)